MIFNFFRYDLRLLMPVANPILTIDLTDDDPESGGLEIWPEVSSGIAANVQQSYGSSSGSSNMILSPVAGPSTSYQYETSSSTVVNQSNGLFAKDFEWESEEYMNFLQKMQDEFNKESNHDDVEMDVVSQGIETVAAEITPLQLNQNECPSTSNSNSTNVAETMNNDLNNNAGTSKQNPIRNSTDYPAFEMLEAAPPCHKFFNSPFAPSKKNFLASVNKDRAMLQNDLPSGIYVKMFENRLDLISALVEGPEDTPYQGCLFIFDIQLSSEHPNKPPKVHYWSFCHQKLNPNLYSNGMVCLSLLGTWQGVSIERWTVKSTIFQLLISIQGLILVQEPYYNEPAFHNAKESNKFIYASKKYNTVTLALVLESMSRQIQTPPEVFKDHILTHYRNTGTQTHQRLESYLPKTGHAAKKAKVEPPFPLQPIPPNSQIEKNLNSFYTALIKLKDQTKM